MRAASDDVDSVSIQPVFWRTGVAGSPSPDKMARVAGQPRVYSGQLWLMARGSYSVYVRDGRREREPRSSRATFANGTTGTSPRWRVAGRTGIAGGRPHHDRARIVGRVWAAGRVSSRRPSANVPTSRRRSRCRFWRSRSSGCALVELSRRRLSAHDVPPANRHGGHTGDSIHRTMKLCSATRRISIHLRAIAPTTAR